MINHDSGKTEWLFTRRAFYQNGAFTLRNPIVFLPQQVKDTSSKETAITEDPEESQKLTGEEAKKIYEDIVNNDHVENTEKIRTNDHKLTPVGRAKKAFTKFRRKSSLLANHFSSSKKHSKIDPPLSVAKLFQLTQSGDVETLGKALLHKECDVNTTDAFNWSLLMSAAYAGHLPVVQLLLKHGAKWQDVRDHKGFDAVDLAAMAGHNNIVELLSSSKTTDCSHSPTTDSDISIRSLRKRRHSTQCEDYHDTFYCQVCTMEVIGDEKKHHLSTVHQFNSQLHSSDIPYSIPQSNKGFQLMIKRGWNPENGLGPSEQGTLQPIKTVLKRDRQGLGSEKKQKPRVTHFTAFDKSAIRCSPIRTRSVTRRQDEEQNIIPRSCKRARRDALEKDKQWEANMRRYLNSDDNNYCLY